MKLKDAIKKSQEGTKRYKVILVNQNKEEYFQESKDLNLKLININKELSELLSDCSSSQKKNESWEILKTYLENLDDDVLAIYNVDYLFSPELGCLNPVHNFNYYSRDKQVIVLFLNARKFGDKLIYSEEGNPDFNTMDISENEFVLGWNDEN